MKAYGLPRQSERRKYIGLDDIHRWVMKGYRMRNRKARRRHFKKRERQTFKNELKIDINQL